MRHVAKGSLEMAGDVIDATHLITAMLTGAETVAS